MDTFNLESFIKKNSSVAIKCLLSFLDVEIKRSSFEDIENFLKTAYEGEDKELTDHFIVKLNLLEVLIYNETIERFAQNPTEYRFIIDIAQLLYLINKKMSDGIESIKAIVK